MSDEPQHDHDNDRNREHDKEVKPANKPTVRTRTQGSDRVLKKGSNRTVKQLERLVGIVDRHTRLVSTRLDHGGAGIDEQESRAMRSALEQERTTMLTLIGSVPSNEPVLVKAMEASDRVSVVIARLDDFGRAHQGKQAVADERAAGTSMDIFSAAAHESHLGYCDTAPQTVAPCELDDKLRAKHRSDVKQAVTKARENYKLALDVLRLELMFTPVPDSFEKKLGAVLLQGLFGLVGHVAKGLFSKGVDKAAEKLTVKRSTPDYVVGSKAYGVITRTEGPEKDAIALAKTAGDKVIEKGAAAAPDAIKSGITAKQMGAQAVAATALPESQLGFLESMKTTPDQWADNILMNVDNLFDEDLAGLVVALPLDSPSITRPAFENQLKDVMLRFKEQVLAIDLAPIAQVRPVQVITAGRPVRTALVAPKKAPNYKLHGEWYGELTNTSKWTFVRWIDDDMKGMANGRAMDQVGEAAMGFMAASNDSEFWDERSLAVLAQERAHD